MTPRPTLKQAAEYLSELRRIFEASDNCEMLANIEKMKSCFFQSVVLKQTKISDYFDAQ